MTSLSSFLWKIIGLVLCQIFIPEIRPTWLLHIILFINIWIQFSNILLMIFIFQKNINLLTLFFQYSFAYIQHQCSHGYWNCIRKYTFQFISGIEWIQLKWIIFYTIGETITIVHALVCLVGSNYETNSIQIISFFLKCGSLRF